MPTLSHYQALLFDVDNTLTKTDKQLANATTAALRKLIDRGYLVGVCTAKTFPILKKKILPHFAKNVLHIASGGAQIITTEGEVAWQKNIQENIFRDLKQKLDAAEANYYVVGQDVLYAHPSLLEYLKQHPFEPAVESTTQLTSYDAVPLFGVYNLTPEILNLLEEYHDYLTLKVMTNHRSGQLYTDVTAVGVNKAVAFEKWCDLTGIPAKEVIGFGDSANDVEFLDLAGYSVAMGNATEEVKAVADRIVGHTDENGLALYLNQVLATGDL